MRFAWRGADRRYGGGHRIGSTDLLRDLSGAGLPGLSPRLRAPTSLRAPAAYGYAPPPPPAQQQAYQSTDPVDQCSRAAVGEAASRGDSGRVTKIDHVDGHPNGARVTGTIEVRRTSHNGEVENARFTCTADYGQVTFFKFG